MNLHVGEDNHEKQYNDPFRLLKQEPLCWTRNYYTPGNESVLRSWIVAKNIYITWWS